MIYSLFIGRWQPLHDGHKYIIKKVLDEGKNVCIAIRNTPLSNKDPFTIAERKLFIRKAFPNKRRVKIIVIPDIEDVCYGRDVGWGIRELTAPQVISSISATKIRERMHYVR